METLLHNFSQVLGITILHSLWQGLLIYALIRLLFIAFPGAGADKKYKALYSGLLAIAIWFGYTFFMEARNYNWSPAAPVGQIASAEHADFNITSSTLPSQPTEQPFYYQYKPLIQNYVPYISALYLLSLLINVTRLAIGWQKIRSIRKRATAADRWQPLADQMAPRAGVIKKVQICFSSLVDVPCAIGYLKPILLLPVSISTQPSAEEIEVIILHELAHIKNNDYILNLIQQIIALLLFLNPFAQLISKMIDIERENRCDDTVMQIGDPLTYAGALVKLEKTRQHNLQLALAATGEKYHLFARIQRIMGDDKPAVNIKHLILGLLIFLGSLASIAWLNPEVKNGRLGSKNGEAAAKRLAMIVKDIITPDPPLQVTPENQIATIALGPTETGDKTAIDSVQIKKAEREALVAELVKVKHDLNEDRKKYTELPEVREAKHLTDILDSIRKIKVKEGLSSPELQKELEDRQRASREYYGSAVYKQKQAESQRLYRAYFDALQRQPEMAQFEQNHKKVWDSLSTQIIQRLGITKHELHEKSAEWREWSTKQTHIRDGLTLKLLNVPEVKALYDSADSARKMISNGPEWELYRAKTKPSQALIIATEPVGLEKYKDTVKKVRLALQNTELWKKLDRNIKRHDEIVQKLKQIKP